MKRTLATICLFSLFLSTGIRAYAQQITPFKEDDRVVFLGNSITDGGHYHAYIWLYYMTRYPQMNLLIQNAGIGGDRVIEMLKRLDGDVFSKQPTVLITTFGMNDSGYLEYNGPEPEKFADSKVKESFEAYKQMEKRFQGLPDTKIVLLGSSPYDEEAVIADNTPLKNKNKAMLRIVDFQRASANQNKWEFFDFNQSMTDINRRFQKTDASFTICGNDRVHPDTDGHMVMAYLFLKAQGFAGKKVAEIAIDASKQRIISSANCTLSDIKKNATGISFDYQANALPYPLDTIPRGWGSKKSQSDAIKVVPFIEEMNQELLTVTGLQSRHKLLIDDEVIGVWSAADFAKGINLATHTNTPQYQQALRVMHLNEARWEIERQFRDYAWVQYNFFQPRGLLDANNRKAIEVLDQHVSTDGWLRAKRDLYAKAMFPEVRNAWRGQMDLLLDAIKDVNTPKKRTLSLVRVK
ncbi:hypothetical protein FAZ19_02380 [Sphingobacterium alkalisoli]|uniref:SGNH hydrolase-type esterase domain-containing protein n=1 Tax=Sphingobacterium alkalisoli TaxID=1874115 RepID=A0A4U0H8C9_9SPHI|nr:SGNH/GDSL hydrolase family protein [Sphingobacterium alkalisoli]TJY68127.1 hypothetical protein FAZ19_02380 [Sphingobacterium alkalisoli]GGH08884.1 hypothetical protein GCM10011418_06550 [Sphingobacterium alkalisoli]